MKIATWNISSGIDMSNYTGELFDKAPKVSADDKCLKQIANAIAENNFDVVCLQEVTTTDSFKFMESLSKLSGLKYFAKFPNSPGFLIKNTQIGTAILSRYPFEVRKMELFANPNLTKLTKNGMYKTHDKGFMEIKILAEKEYNIINTQVLPFHRFDAKILDYKSTFEEFQNEILQNNAIVCGDFNVVTGKKDLQKLLDKVEKRYNIVFDEVTTTDNKLCDNILVPKTLPPKDSAVLKNYPCSDHFLCYVEI